MNQNYNINENNLLKIIDANFINTTRPRSLFKNSPENGRNTLENLVSYIVSKEAVDKGEMFGQKYYDQHRSLRFLIKMFWNRYNHIALRFASTFVKDEMVSSLKLSKSFKTNRNNSFANSKKQILEESCNYLKEISLFFTYLSVEEPEFQGIVNDMYKKLSRKYGKQSSIEIMKKILLNRFLLNAEMLIRYSEWEGEEKLNSFA